MKNVQKELLSITASISAIASKIEKMAEAIAKDTGKVATTKKAKAPAKKAKAAAKKVKAPAKKAKAPAKKAKATVKKAKAPAKAKATPKKRAVTKVAPVAKTAQKKATDGTGIFDSVYATISGNPDGITVATLKNKTGLEKRQVNNALYKLKQKGQIEAISRGVYALKKA
jgi:hypothetical protein